MTTKKANWSIQCGKHDKNEKTWTKMYGVNRRPQTGLHLRTFFSVVCRVFGGGWLIVPNLAQIWQRLKENPKAYLMKKTFYKEKRMSKKNVEALLIAGGEKEELRMKYDTVKTKEDFVIMAANEGYEFTLEEFEAVINESGDSFDLIGNPAKRQIWWR